MEDNNVSNDAPIFCTNGCGFYGNKIYNNMCSKCFKETNKSSSTPTAETARTPTPPQNPSTSTAVPADKVEQPNGPNHLERDVSTPNTDSDASTPTEVTTGGKPVQNNKGRCFVCRAKIPLAKQAVNKCRCDYVFCDAHRLPNQHDCEFDFATSGKDILAKNNPKLNDRPKGGRSFTRIDSA